jgi:iodotyrosine deiodinase
MSKPRFIPLQHRELSESDMLRRSREFAEELHQRRTVREFSDRPVPKEIIENCIRAAGSSPSGANLQPWQFVAVSDPELKRKIRVAAEEEEREFYTRRAPQEWLAALAPLGTDEHKPFLETAPWLIVIFVEKHGMLPDGRKVKHYYPADSTGIATGMLITALHHAGLATLTHTPSPMGFLREVLGRPRNERAFMILVAGYPADGAQVPDIHRKPLDDIATFV